MSKIGKIPIKVPKEVEVKLDGSSVSAKGPKGNLEYQLPARIEAELTDGEEGKEIVVRPKAKKLAGPDRMLWGTARSRVENVVTGVAEGFEKKLEIHGVGYKAAASGKKLTLNLGYSHPIDYEMPEGVDVEVKKNVIKVSGADKEMVGAAAAKVRSFREPEPYKGKGIRYHDEQIIRKEGKKAAGEEGGE
jgi:large subunit ribosomal protein L6